jgi:outer membrane immunogenic protein
MSNVSGGGQIGYNWQINQIVLGAEADFQYIGLKETNRFTQTVSAPPASISVPYTFTKTSQADWLSTVRARVGYAWDRLLIYGTGGLAITESKSSDILSFNGDPNFTSTGSRSNVQLGWTAGGGLEWAFAARWSAKAEYLYARFPSKTTAKTTFIGNPVFFDAYTDRLTVNVARAGVNYRF